MKTKLLRRAACAAALMTLTGPASAVVFDFTNNQSYPGVDFGYLGNDAVTFDNGSRAISAQAYSLVANNSASGYSHTFRRAALTRNANRGLGVNRGNDSSGQIDNQDNIDLVLFDFGRAAADPIRMLFSLVSGNDNVSLWVGNGLEALYQNASNNIDSFLNLNFNRLVNRAGFVNVGQNINLGSNNPYNFYRPGTDNHRYLVVAAPHAGVTSNLNDNFRISGLSVQGAAKSTAPLPEPGVWALLLGGLACMRRFVKPATSS